MTMKKYEQILNYLTEIPNGTKVSVRGIAKILQVSEGTAYYAIKLAENKGIVATIPRIGTIRMVRSKREHSEQISFAEVVNIVRGQVLGGKEGLHKTLGKFLIGAMEIEAMMGYIHNGDLLIVGNRHDAHEKALQAGAAVLVTGGFTVKEDIKKLADQLKLPLILSEFDTFTVAKMINRVLYDQQMKRDILLVEDVLERVEEGKYLFTNDTISKWHQINIDSKLTRFPVVNEEMQLQGIVTSSDILGEPFELEIEEVMTKKLVTTSSNVSLSSAAHIMVREGVEILPVVDYKDLVGVIRKEAVNRALQLKQMQPDSRNTFGNDFDSGLLLMKDHYFEIEVVPQLANYQGVISYGAFTSILAEVANRTFQSLKYTDFMIESITIFFLKNIPMNTILEFYPNVFDIQSSHGKIDIVVKSDEEIVGKALLSCQLIST